MGKYLQNQYLERDYAMELSKKHGLFNEIDRLKEQLKEANNIIVKADWDCDYELQMKCVFSDYLKKYDVRGIV